MLHTKADFLAAIKASPDDDTLRLVYADFLEENGEAMRAEFIRVQVELASAPECGRRHDIPHCSAHQIRRCLLRIRERELWEVYGRPLSDEWGFALEGRRVVLTPVEGDDFGLGNGDIEGVFRRGFVESVTCSAADWFAHGDHIYKNSPVVLVNLADHPNLFVNLSDGPVEQPPYDTRRVLGGVVVAGRVIAAESRLSRAEMAASNFNLLEGARAQVIAKLAPENVLPIRWPGVEFEMPSH